MCPSLLLSHLAAENSFQNKRPRLGCKQKPRVPRHVRRLHTTRFVSMVIYRRLPRAYVNPNTRSKVYLYTTHTTHIIIPTWWRWLCWLCCGAKRLKTLARGGPLHWKPQPTNHHLPQSGTVGAAPICGDRDSTSTELRRGAAFGGKFAVAAAEHTLNMGLCTHMHHHTHII